MADYHKNIRKQKLDEYYQNPLFCKQCGDMIHPREKEKISNLKKREFCSKHCTMLWRNKNVPHKKIDIFMSKTKLDLVKQYKGRSLMNAAIARNATRLLLRNDIVQKCLICGYNSSIEVCHIKPVAEFSDDTKISDINNLDNLIFLCSNHHYMFDNKLLSKEEIMKAKNSV